RTTSRATRLIPLASPRPLGGRRRRARAQPSPRRRPRHRDEHPVTAQTNTRNHVFIDSDGIICILSDVQHRGSE
ncbi:MAG: hypothetical protein WBC15_22005, partial [Mycobacterium sp.]